MRTLTFGIAVLVAAGCGKKDDKPAPSPAPSAEAATPAAPTGDTPPVADTPPAPAEPRPLDCDKDVPQAIRDKHFPKATHKPTNSASMPGGNTMASCLFTDGPTIYLNCGPGAAHPAQEHADSLAPGMPDRKLEVKGDAVVADNGNVWLMVPDKSCVIAVNWDKQPADKQLALAEDIKAQLK